MKANASREADVDEQGYVVDPVDVSVSLVLKEDEGTEDKRTNRTKDGGGIKKKNRFLRLSPSAKRCLFAKHR